jgi:hypothetical protein
MPSSYKKRIYQAAVSQRLRTTGAEHYHYTVKPGIRLVTELGIIV